MAKEDLGRWADTKMTMDEWNEYLDGFVAREQAKAGVETPVFPAMELDIMTQHESAASGYGGGIFNRVCTADGIARFCFATGNMNPLFLSPDYAASTEYGGIIAPTMYEMCLCSAFKAAEVPTIGGVNIYDAGSKWERFQHIRPGDEFHAYNKYVGVKEKTKPGSPYRLFEQKSTTYLLNQRNEVVARMTGGNMITCSAPGKMEEASKKAGGEYVLPKYTQEQLDKIYANMDDQLAGKFRRGAQVRYWEDVNVGDELPDIVYGPYDDSDGLSICSAMGFSVAFATKWASIKSALDHASIDPETGAYRSSMDWHCSDHMARQVGVPYAIVYGLHSQAALAYAIDSWMGDAGFCKVLDCKCRAMLYMGDVTTVNGKVTKKWEENGEHLVELSLNSIRWGNGDNHTPATAIVRLKSRG